MCFSGTSLWTLVLSHNVWRFDALESFPVDQENKMLLRMRCFSSAAPDISSFLVGGVFISQWQHGQGC